MSVVDILKFFEWYKAIESPQPLECHKTLFWQVGQTLCYRLISNPRRNTRYHQNPFLNLDIRRNVSLYISVALLPGFGVYVCTVSLFQKLERFAFAFIGNSLCCATEN